MKRAILLLKANLGRKRLMAVKSRDSHLSERREEGLQCEVTGTDLLVHTCITVKLLQPRLQKKVGMLCNIANKSRMQ